MKWAKIFFTNIKQFLHDEYIDKNIANKNMNTIFDLDNYTTHRMYNTWWYPPADGSFTQHDDAINKQLNDLFIEENINIQIDNENWNIIKISNTECKEKNVETKETRRSLSYDEQIDMDCGIFMLKCADWIFDGLFPDFRETQMNGFSKRIVVELVHGKILEGLFS